MSGGGSQPSVFFKDFSDSSSEQHEVGNSLMRRQQVCVCVCVSVCVCVCMYERERESSRGRVRGEGGRGRQMLKQQDKLSA